MHRFSKSSEIESRRTNCAGRRNQEHHAPTDRRAIISGKGRLRSSGCLMDDIAAGQQHQFAGLILGISNAGLSASVGRGRLMQDHGGTRNP
ncbi:hypothetical protein WA026_020224 [Henosepilachna vigintioctopunctata]|uniref:Uncharacterized protein n=1 Tax=Henosepilachna vigintioctopunctata TaxID=420089 RepID=A0AAW1UD04_9CUCU